MKLQFKIEGINGAPNPCVVVSCWLIDSEGKSQVGQMQSVSAGQSLEFPLNVVIEK